MIPVHELDDETAAAIASVEVREEFEGQGGNRRDRRIRPGLHERALPIRLSAGQEWPRLAQDAAQPRDAYHGACKAIAGSALAEQCLWRPGEQAAADFSKQETHAICRTLLCSQT
jgi:hypothetical protein